MRHYEFAYHVLTKEWKTRIGNLLGDKMAVQVIQETRIDLTIDYLLWSKRMTSQLSWLGDDSATAE